jgi:hypothetical protein
MEIVDALLHPVILLGFVFLLLLLLSLKFPQCFWILVAHNSSFGVRQNIGLLRKCASRASGVRFSNELIVSS